MQPTPTIFRLFRQVGRFLKIPKNHPSMTRLWAHREVIRFSGAEA
jgi:hypothetical protein